MPILKCNWWSCREHQKEVSIKIIEQSNNWKKGETKVLTSGIEVLKLVKKSSHIDIESLKKLSDERDKIDKGDQLNKKLQMPKKD